MSNMPKGWFITFEGPEGAGKSSACAAVLAAFPSLNIKSVREPGSTELGEKIRTLVHNEEMPDRSELMLFEAARACLVDTVISPALWAGTHVLCDRFYDSTTAYQGYGRGLPLMDISIMNSMATSDLKPDITILFDIDPKIGMTRKGKATDRIEAAGEDFHNKVRNGFLAIAKAAPSRVKVVDASRPIEDVSEDVIAILESNLGWKRA